MNISDGSQNLIIKPGEIHVWCIDDEIIGNNSIIPEYFKQLSEQERVQRQKFHFEAGRHQYLITRLCIRNILSLYVKNIRPYEWVFDKNKFGKPSISNIEVDAGLEFNISHTKKMIVIALSFEGPIGVDVENLERNSSFLKIAKHSFSSYEYEALCLLPVNLQKSRFFELWTLKESYTKARGMGLSIPLDKFSFSFSGEKEIEISFDSSQNDNSKDWSFWCLKINDLHQISLSIKNDTHDQNHKIKVREVSSIFDVTEIDFLISKQSKNTGH